MMSEETRVSPEVYPLSVSEDAVNPSPPRGSGAAASSGRAPHNSHVPSPPKSCLDALDT
jgi:hypothetical protein